MKKEDKSAMLAAAAILCGTFLAFYFMPDIMLSAGRVSPWLAIAIGAFAVLGFFLVFWLRGRFGSQRGSEEKKPENEHK